MDPIARWKDLCLDAVDPDLLGRFWAAALGDDRIWINQVDRPRTVKNRVHLDVHAVSVADLEALGARVVAHEADTGFDWTVMADPEGGEFCAFVSEHTRRRGLYGVVVDCADAQAQARWWAEALGAEVDASYAPEAWGVPHAALAPPLVFVPVPEPRTGPNRVHWDTYGDAAALTAAGATPLWDSPSDRGHWTVLADPEGNEFCVFPPGPSPSPAG